MDQSPFKKRHARETYPSIDSRFQIILTDDGSRTVVCSSDGQSFHSESGAVAEAQTVYLENSGVLQRLKEGKSVRIFELGFGFGLNFFVTASAAMSFRAQLEYFAVENRPVSNEVLKQLGLLTMPETQAAWAAWLNAMSTEELSPKIDEQKVLEWEHVRYSIYECDFLNFEPEAGQRFDSIYFDPFSPESNPDLWTEFCFRKCFHWLDVGGTLVTYCVKRTIQDSLGRVGFRVEKLKGPKGGKREVLVAFKDKDFK